MDLKFKSLFIEKWNNYFPGAELPITFHYADEEQNADTMPAAKEHRCIICDLARVRNGASLQFNEQAAACGGAKKYLGFTQHLRHGFEYFLSCGIPNVMEGERYKKSPEIVKEMLMTQPDFKAPGKYIVFKRWDNLDEQDEPAVVIFFASPDTLSGLFTLAGFDESDTYAVIAPFSAGCGSIIQHPYRQIDLPNPKTVLGMFDVSARPCVPSHTLTLAAPWSKFVRMVNDMDESFLITESWKKVQKRMESDNAQ